MSVALENLIKENMIKFNEYLKNPIPENTMKYPEHVQLDIDTYPGTEEHMENHPDIYNFKYRTYQCAIRRYDKSHICGYFEIHPNCDGNKLEEEVHIHGGITGGNYVNNINLAGFDCAHYHDFVPSQLYLAMGKEESEERIYRDYNWVKKHIEEIVDYMVDKYGYIYPTTKNANDV